VVARAVVAVGSALVAGWAVDVAGDAWEAVHGAMQCVE
jgi:hypothetical protein